MKFEKTPPTWNAEGSEPPSSLKTSGFQSGYKPPAAYFNWFWNKVSACLTELQTKLSNVDNTKDADKSVKYASTSGSANKTKGSMVVRLNGGSTEGTDLFTFDGSTGKSVNITADKIGAASESKLPFWATYGTTTNAEIEAAYQAGNQVLVKTTDGYVGELFARLSSGKAHFFCAGVKIYRCFNGNWTDLSDSYGFTPTVHASTHKKGGSDPIKPEDIGAAAASNGTVLSQNADYAEVGEWADGNPNSENRIGYFVAIDDTQAGTTIIKATSTKDVRGVVVTAPAFSGNCSADKFDSNGNLLKQYAYVAVMGLVSVIDNGTCTINERCMPNDSGTAVPSSNNLGYQVIDRIDDTHILIAVEPSADMIQRIKMDMGNKADLVGGKVPSSQLPEISSVKTYTATIGTTWTENEDTGVKTQTVAIPGVLASHTAKVDHAYTGTTTSPDYEGFVEAENQYLTCITNGYAETVAGGIKFTIFGDANTVSIPIVVEVA